jgi:hypothetical protein
VETDFVLDLAVIQDGQRVAVGNRHDFACDGLGLVSQQGHADDDAKLEHGRIVPFAFVRCAPQNRGAFFSLQCQRSWRRHRHGMRKRR